MHEIYSKAKTIYISLGNWESRLAEESKCFKEGVEIESSGRVRRTFSYPVPQGDGKFEDLKLTGPVSAVHASFAVANELLKELAAYLFDETHWERLKPVGSVPTAWKIVADVLGHEYWQRKWILQEIALGTEIRIMISQFTVRWEDVLGAYIMVNRMVHPLEDPEKDELRLRHSVTPNLDVLGSLSGQRSSSLLTIGQAIMSIQQRDLSELLLRLARPNALQTSWAIDSVYAVRALFKDFGDIPPPRYELGSRDVFIENSRWFVQHGFGAEILIARTYDGISLGELERPSWSIDWSSKHMTINWETISYNHSYFHGYRNPSTTFTRIEDLAAMSENITLLADRDDGDKNRLRIRGSVIDVVAEALPQPEGCRSSITFDQACDFVTQARSRRTEDSHAWVVEFLNSTDRGSKDGSLKNLSFMKHHRALLENLELFLTTKDTPAATMGAKAEAGVELAGAESTSATSSTAAVESHVRRFFASQEESGDPRMHHFTLFSTSSQAWSGIGPEHIRTGDLLITVSGPLPTVFVLRKVGEEASRCESKEDYYILIGQAEVIAHAGDYGLALAMSREEKEFVIC